MLAPVNDMKFFLVPILLASVAAAVVPAPTAVDVAANIFESCVKFGSFSCVKPKVLKFLSASLKNDQIVLTEDMSIVNNGRFSSDPETPEPLPKDEKAERERIRFLMWEKIDNFLNSHQLKVKLPKEIVTGEVFPFLPKFLLDSVPQEVSMPLSDTKDVAQERGFVKKVMIPFLLGLKFKAALIPLGIALIALKTWKALTLGLLSLVLSAAMVIFKFTKPKVVNYEVYHYPSHHHPPSPPIEHPYVDHHHGPSGYGRSDSQTLAYRAHRK